jgi:hypothetical protein
VPARLIEQQHGVRAGGNDPGNLGQVQVHRLGGAARHDEPGPVPRAGQIAPKRSAEAVRWSFGAEGRVPRRAQRRVMVFFCPTRASSQNQTSIGLPPVARAISAKRAGQAF